MEWYFQLFFFCEDFQDCHFSEMPGKKVLTKSVVRRIAEYTFVVVFSACITLIIMSFKSRNFSKIINFSKGKVINPSFEDSEENKKIVEYAKIAFNTYAKHCSDADEIYLETHKCKRSDGFVSTAVQSLETLYLLKLNPEFKKAKSIVLEHLQPKKIGWVNRAQFWNKCIGSLIGAFRLSQDSDLIHLAFTLADSVIDLQTSKLPTHINIAKHQSSNAEWLNSSVPISEVLAGVPELLTLYAISGQDKYKKAADHIIAKISKISETPPHYVHFRTFQPVEIGTIFKIDGNILDYYNNLAILSGITENEKIKEKLESINSNINEVYSKELTFDHLFTKQLYSRIGIALMFSGHLDVKSNFYFDQTIRENWRTITDFRFRGNPLRALLEHDQTEFNKVVNHVLNYTKLNDGFTGQLYTNKKRWVKSGVQNLSLIHI